MSTGIQKLAKWFRDYRGFAILLFVVLLVWAGCESAKAEMHARLSLGAGVSNNNEWITQEIEVRGKHWFGSVLRTGDDDRLPDTWRYVVGWRGEWRSDKFFSPCIKFGAAYWQDDITPLISDDLSYHMALCARIGPVIEVEYQHNSTAGRAEFNNGNDLLLLGFTKRF